MTVSEIKGVIKRKLISQMIMMESAVKNNNNSLAYENVNLIKAYIMLLIEIEENEDANS